MAFDRELVDLITDILPMEIMESIFRMLTPTDLKNVVLVSKRWRETGENPSLWTWCTVHLDSKKDLGKLNIRRLQQLQKISMPEMRDWNNLTWKEASAAEELFECLGKLTKLRSLKNLIWNVELSSVETSLLARVISRLVVVDLEYIIQAVAEKSELKELNLTKKKLWLIEPSVLADVVTRLAVVNMVDTEITSEQAQAVFEAMGRGSAVKKLVVSGTKNLSSVKPAVLAKAVSMVEDACLSYTDVTSIQAQALFEVIAGQSAVKVLGVSGINLSRVQSGALARAVNKLEVVYMQTCHLSAYQVTSILSWSVEHGTTLKELYLGGNKMAGVDKMLIKVSKKKINELYTSIQWIK